MGSVGIAQPPAHGAVQHRFVIGVLAFMAGWPQFKFANVQVLEMFMLGHLMFLLFSLGLNGFRTEVRGLWISPGRNYALVMAGILFVSMSSIRLPRYPPMYGPYFLHVPLLVVAMRYMELFVVVFYCLYAAELMRRDSRLRDYALRAYLNSAIVTSFITFLGLFIWKATGATLGVNGEGRGQGMFPEGGPWGLYLLTVGMVVWILWKRRAISHSKMVFAAGTLLLAFYYSRSKACVFCAFLIFVTQILMGRSWRQKLVSVAALAVISAAAWWIFDVPRIYSQMTGLREKAEVTVFLNRDDPNIAYGRVAGSVIIPRMIAAHPWLGIGLGNYPVMRNDPKYLGIMYKDRYYDLPGLGLLWVAAELGLISLVALYGIMLYPALRVRRTRGHPLLLTLALCQPFVHLMGAQITLFYPWITSAFVLSFLPLPGTKAAVAPQPAGNMLRVRTTG
jgi:hypothetical protein